MRHPDKTFGPVVDDNDPPQDIARAFVFDYARRHLDPSDEKHATFAFDEVYVVQFFYILGNWKALVSTTLPDGMYYEVTYNKPSGEVTLKSYKRTGHVERPIPVPGADDLEFETEARRVVQTHLIYAYNFPVDPLFEICLRSFNYIDGCWKTLATTNLEDGLLFEITADPRKQVCYLDEYKLFEAGKHVIPSRAVST